MYREIDLTNWKKVGQGSNGYLYACDNDDSVVLKINKSIIAVEKFVLKEYNQSRNVTSLGLRTPEAKEVVSIDGKLGIIFENIKNKKSYSRLLADDEDNFEKYVKDFAKKCKELHNTPSKTNSFESATYKIRKGIENAKFIKKYKPCLLRLLDDMDKKTTCLHGDLQTGNLIKSNGVDYWIDLEKFSYGDSILDIAHMYTIYHSMAWFPYIQSLLHLKKKQLNRFWYLFLNEYYGFNKKEADLFNKKLDIYNALELLTKNYLHPGVYADIVTFILARPKIKKYCKRIRANSKI